MVFPLLLEEPQQCVGCRRLLSVQKNSNKIVLCKSTYGTDSAPLKYTLKQFHYSRSIWSLRDLTDTKVAQIALKYKKTPHFTNTNTGLLTRVPL